jgi:fucose 4-O-acetylase-like acetyltransferase
MKAELSRISFLQTFGILLVVLGHAFYRIPPDHPVIRWIYGFHMPLFFFISGYLLRYTQTDVSTLRSSFLTRKARRLLLPYLIISSLVFVPKALMSTYAVRPIRLSWHDYFDQLLYPYHNVLGAYWFLPTLMLIFVVFFIAVKVQAKLGLRLRRWWATAILLAIHVSIPFHHDSLLNLIGVAYYLFYFVLGFEFRGSSLEPTIDRLKIAFWLPLTLGISMLMLTLPPFALQDHLTALNGILLGILLARLYERRSQSFLQHLYGHTFTIYLYSGLFQILSLQVLLHFVTLPAYIYIPLAFVTGVYGPWLIDRLKSSRQP